MPNEWSLARKRHSEGLKYGALEFGPKQFAVLAKPTSDVEIQYRTGTVRFQPIFPKNYI